MKFEDLKLIPPILKALRDENYSVPTIIQAKSIPLVLNGEDVLGSAQTGTGKTAAFAIPIIQNLLNDQQFPNSKRKISSLIITPTRELAIQIGESFTVYAKYTKLKNTVIFGGVAQRSQTNILRSGIDILIATPGRLLDLMDQGYISLRDVKYFVLDEADRMLDMGFIHDIKKILNKLPKERQSLFFSATMPQNILDLSQQILINPKKVTVNPVSSAAETIQQYLYTTNRKNKSDLLLHILKNPELELYEHKGLTQFVEQLQGMVNEYMIENNHIIHVGKYATRVYVGLLQDINSMTKNKNQELEHKILTKIRRLKKLKHKKTDEQLKDFFETLHSQNKEAYQAIINNLYENKLLKEH